jgi:hypothetical protein
MRTALGLGALIEPRGIADHVKPERDQPQCELEFVHRLRFSEGQTAQCALFPSARVNHDALRVDSRQVPPIHLFSGNSTAFRFVHTSAENQRAGAVPRAQPWHTRRKHANRRATLLVFSCGHFHNQEDPSPFGGSGAGGRRVTKSGIRSATCGRGPLFEGSSFPPRSPGSEHMPIRRDPNTCSELRQSGHREPESRLHRP